MTEQHLDDADIDAVFQQVGGEAMPQGMGSDPLGDIGRLSRLDDNAVNCRVLIGTVALRPGKSQPPGSMMPCCRPVRHQSRNNGSSPSGSMALRYRPPLPRSIRSTIRLLSTSLTLSAEISATRSPAP